MPEWIASNGRHIAVEKMTSVHIEAAIKFLRERYHEAFRELQSAERFAERFPVATQLTKAIVFQRAFEANVTAAVWREWLPVFRRELERR